VAKTKSIKEIDQFVGSITKIGNSHGIIIPHNNLMFSGLKKGDILRVWYRRAGGFVSADKLLKKEDTKKNDNPKRTYESNQGKRKSFRNVCKGIKEDRKIKQENRKIGKRIER